MIGGHPYGFDSAWVAAISGHQKGSKACELLESCGINRPGFIAAGVKTWRLGQFDTKSLNLLNGNT